MVGVGNADIWRCPRCNIGNNIAVDPAVVRVQPQIYGNIWVECRKFFNCVPVNLRLCFVGIIFCTKNKEYREFWDFRL